MSNLKITHTSKDASWTDEAGTAVPFNRITKSEKLMESYTARLRKGAVSINKQLVEFKALIKELSAKAYEAFMAERNAHPEAKGNFTWYNFNRTIKIQVDVQERIEFDDLTIKLAKAKFDEFLDKNIQSSNEFAKQLVMDAFETQRKQSLDTKKILSLTRHKDRINDPLFTEAVNLINEAIRRPDSKTYFRIWVKDNAGEYKSIDLNLSNI